MNSYGARPKFSTRQSVLFDPADVAPIGSQEWATARKEELQSALGRAIGGRIDFTKEMVHFYRAEGWKALRDHEGNPFRTCRAFAVAKHPEGLMLSLKQFKGFIADMHQAVQESAAEAEVLEETNPLPRQGEVGRGRIRGSVRTSNKRGETTDYLARRIARDHPAILVDMKAGAYPSVRAAAKAAGIVKEKTPLEQLCAWWKKASPAERQQFLATHTQEGV